MTVVIDGTTGISGVDGTASSPAIEGTDSNTGIFFPAADTIAFAEGGAEVARFDSAGNFGLGVTPSAWKSDRKAFQVGPTSLVGFGTTLGVLYNNSYYNSSGVDTYINSGAASAYALSGNNHAWYIAPSGTAGNAITFTQAMTLNASSQLSLNTTAANELLNIYANNFTYIGMYNSTTGTTSSDGGYIGMSNAELEIRNKENSIISLWTNNTERARITSGGFLKAQGNSTYENSAGNYHEFVSAIDNEVTLNVRSNAANGQQYGIAVKTANDQNDATRYFLTCQSVAGGTVRAQIRSNGGLANFSANNVNLSDRREKTNFAPAKNYLDVICAIPVQTFNYIDQNMEEDPGETLGVVAQDVQSVAPEMVMESNWGTKEEPKMRLSIYQTDLQYALMKCIQELKAELDAMKAEVAALKGAA